MLPNDITIILIHSDDKELFKKCREIWNKINELIGINDLANFVVTNLDGRDDFIILKLEKRTTEEEQLLEINIEMILYFFTFCF